MITWVIYINEWIPNPVGADATGEFVELYNSASNGVDLNGWKLGIGTVSSSTGMIVPAKTKPFPLGGYSIAPRGYLVLRRAQTKLSLKNTDGALLLYGPGGNVADSASFLGSAPAGESVSRMSYDDASPAQHFAFTDPTPGAPNAPFDDAVTVRRYPEHVPLNPQSSPASTILQGIALAAIIAFLFIYAIKKNNHISHILFGGNETSR